MGWVSLSLSLGFNGHFPGDLGYPVFIEAKDDGGSDDNWTTGAMSCKVPVKSSPPTNQHRFFTGQMPFLSPNQHCQSIEGKISHSMDLLTPSSPEVFQLCLWPLGYFTSVSIISQKNCGKVLKFLAEWDECLATNGYQFGGNLISLDPGTFTRVGREQL